MKENNLIHLQLALRFCLPGKITGLLKGGLGLRGSAPDASRICVFSVIKASALADAFYVLDSKILNLHQRAVFLCFSCYCEKQVNYVSQFADLNIFFRCYVMKLRQADSRFTGQYLTFKVIALLTQRTD